MKYIEIATNYFGDIQTKIIPITEENIILIDWFKRINSAEGIEDKVIEKKANERSSKDKPCTDMQCLNSIFLYWNSKDIIVHRSLTDSIAKAIGKALKLYSEEQIRTYIDRYDTILKDKAYFFNYKWTLSDFLTRKDGISSFTDEGSKWINYLSKTKGYRPQQAPTTGYKII